MTTTTNQTAYNAGHEDGQTRARDAVIARTQSGRGTANLAAEVATWFAADRRGADAALINALGYGQQLADTLGLLTEEVEEHDSEAWRGALESYNQGFEAGAKAAAAEVDAPDAAVARTINARELGRFHVEPVSRNQHVEVFYGYLADGSGDLVRMRHDTTDGRKTYAWVPAEEVPEDWGGPDNSAPAIPRDAWRVLTVTED